MSSRKIVFFSQSTAFNVIWTAGHVFSPSFGQYQLVIWPIPVGDLPNSGWWQYAQYWLAKWSIPVGDLVNTGCQYRQRYSLMLWFDSECSADVGMILLASIYEEI